MKSTRWIVGIVLAAVACSGLLMGPASAVKEKPKKKKRAASTKQLMKGIVFPNCKALGAALKASDSNWEEIALRAAMLNEGGHVLMDDGRCPSGEWATGAKTVQKCSQVILDHVKEKNIEGARSAFKVLTSKGCGTCHKKHKK